MSEQATHSLTKNLPLRYFTLASRVAALEKVQKDLVFYNMH